MPDVWRGLLFLGFFSLVSVWITYRLRRPAIQIGMDELGVFWHEGGRYFRLDFVRANGVQLIARYKRNKRVLDYIFPAFRVIYRDSVCYETYRILRSFAAQQMLLRRSEEARERFK